MASLWINADRTIIEADEEWNRLARHNKATYLEANYLAGKGFWQFIQGDQLRLFLEAVLTRVLITGKSYLLHYRCDSDTHAQFMRMLITREKEDLLRIQHDCTHTEEIFPPILFTEDATAHLKRCAICGRVEFLTQWHDALTHRKIFGTLKELPTRSEICPDCTLSKVIPLQNEIGHPL